MNALQRLGKFCQLQILRGPMVLIVPMIVTTGICCITIPWGHCLVAIRRPNVTGTPSIPCEFLGFFNTYIANLWISNDDIGVFSHRLILFCLLPFFACVSFRGAVKMLESWKIFASGICRLAAVCSTEMHEEILSEHDPPVSSRDPVEEEVLLEATLLIEVLPTDEILLLPKWSCLTENIFLNFFHIFCFFELLVLLVDELLMEWSSNSPVPVSTDVWDDEQYPELKSTRSTVFTSIPELAYSSTSCFTFCCDLGLHVLLRFVAAVFPDSIWKFFTSNRKQALTHLR